MLGRLVLLAQSILGTEVTEELHKVLTNVAEHSIRLLDLTISRLYVEMDEQTSFDNLFLIILYMSKLILYASVYEM